MFEHLNSKALKVALRCQNIEAKGLEPTNLLNRTRWGNKNLLVSGAIAEIALSHELRFISGLQLSRCPCPSYRPSGLEIVNITTEYGTLSSCCTCSSPLNPFVLLYPRPQRCAILFLLFSFSTHLYNTSRALSFFFLIASLSSEFTAALPRSFAKCSICSRR